MKKCTTLEQEIKTSEANAQMLMQAVLKEAFEGEKGRGCNMKIKKIYNKSILS